MKISNSGRPGPRGVQGDVGPTGPTGPDGNIVLDVIGSSPNAYGASFTNGMLNLQPANGTYGGILSNTTQAIAGEKTFNDKVIAQKNLTLPSTSTGGTGGVISFGNAGTRIHDYSPYGTVKNCFWGYDAGNFSGTHSYNIGIGTEALRNITTGNSNIVLGHGTSSLQNGSSNILLNGGTNITSGSRNVIAGYLAGNNYSTENDNICISNQGVANDVGNIRIGTQGWQTKAFIAGINGNTLTNASAVVIDSNGQLGATGFISSLAAIGSTGNANGASLN